MRILRARDHRRMPWKNGGGETIEIAVHPPGAGLADFAWRVSMARVASEGPFSVFEGVERTLCVLSGAGMRLEIDGLGTIDLTRASEPLRFAADAATSAQLHEGAITDLNVMTRRGAAEHRVERLLVEGEVAIEGAGGWTLFLAHGAMTIGRPGEVGKALATDDAVLVEGRGMLLVRAEAPATGFLVRIDA